MWNGSIKLLRRYLKEEPDDDGFKKVTVHKTESIPAGFMDVTRNDQILASRSGYNIDRNIEIAACNYQRQQFLEEDSTGELFEVMRTFQKDKSMMITLTCRRREPGAVYKIDTG